MNIFRNAVLAILTCGLLTSCAPIDVTTFQKKEFSCGEIKPNSAPGDSVVMLVAPTSNFTSSESVLNAAAGALSDDFSGKTTLKTFLVSRDNKLASSVVIDLTNTISSEAKLKKIKKAMEFTKLAVSCYVSENPQSPELDLLSAIKAAGESMSGNAGNKRIFVFSNGIQTAGDLRLQESFEARTDDITDLLEEADALPELTNTSLFFYGLGQTSGHQPVFSTKSLNKLEDIWLSIITRSGGKFTNKGSIDLQKGNPKGPEIAIVPPLYVQPVVIKCAATLTDENLAFVSDSAEFLSPQKAGETFKTLQQQFGANNCRGKIKVSGFTTNFGTVEQQKTIATARAKAVADALVGLIPNMETEFVGIGYDGTGDLDASNRRVEVSIG